MYDYAKLIRKCQYSIQKLYDKYGPDPLKWSSDKRQLLQSQIDQKKLYKKALYLPQNFLKFLYDKKLSGKKYCVSTVRVLTALLGFPRGREEVRVEPAACSFIDIHWDVFSPLLSQLEYEDIDGKNFFIKIFGKSYQVESDGHILDEIKRIHKRGTKQILRNSVTPQFGTEVEAITLVQTRYQEDTSIDDNHKQGDFVNFDAQPDLSFSFDRPDTPFSFDRPDTPFSFDHTDTPFTFDRPDTPFSFDHTDTPFSFDRPDSPFSFDHTDTPFSFDRLDD